MTKLSISKFKDALVGSYGVQAVIAKKCEVDRSAITLFLDRHPELRELCKAEREKIIDVSENRLFKAANNGEKWAVDKILNTIGKNRGYIEKHEIESKSLNINVDMDSAKSMNEIYYEIKDGQGDTKTSNKNM